MKQSICWTERSENGVKREVRVEVAAGGIRWQFKRFDEATWDYDSEPDADDWDKLEEILERRCLFRKHNPGSPCRWERSKAG